MGKHNWSGWPGAYCTKCGAEHALENAMALEWFDSGGPVLIDGKVHYTPSKWDTKEHEEIVAKADGFCQVEDDVKGAKK